LHLLLLERLVVLENLELLDLQWDLPLLGHLEVTRLRHPEHLLHLLLLERLVALENLELLDHL
jgi:hypothetical protein